MIMTIDTCLSPPQKKKKKKKKLFLIFLYWFLVLIDLMIKCIICIISEQRNWKETEKLGSCRTDTKDKHF